MKTVKTFKYLGAMFEANGGAEQDVNNRVNIVWLKWRETTGVMCDRNIPTKCTRRLYNRPWCMVQDIGQLERRRRGNCTQIKCACSGGQEKRRD